MYPPLDWTRPDQTGRNLAVGPSIARRACEQYIVSLKRPATTVMVVATSMSPHCFRLFQHFEWSGQRSKRIRWIRMDQLLAPPAEGQMVSQLHQKEGAHSGKCKKLDTSLSRVSKQKQGWMQPTANSKTTGMPQTDSTRVNFFSLFILLKPRIIVLLNC